MDTINIPLEIYRRENLKFYNVDTRISLWKSPDGDKIFAYAAGKRIGKDGLLGVIPSVYLNSIKNLVDDKHCMARIVLLTVESTEVV